jgi:hypothetical protein
MHFLTGFATDSIDKVFNHVPTTGPGALSGCTRRHLAKL